MQTNRITRKRKALIIKLRDEGLTHQSIAEQVGCHRNTVGSILRREGMS